MATVLDLGVLQFFLPVFSFLLVFAVVYAILDKFKLLGESELPKLVIAFCIGLIFLFSADAVRFINFVSPWFAVMIIMMLFLLTTFLFMGVREGELVKAVEDPRVYWPVLVIGIILFLVALTQVFEGRFPVSGEGGRVGAGVSALVHPRVLGAIILLLMAALSIKFISETVSAGGK